MWSFAVHLPQGSTCCALKDALLHISVVISDLLLLSYHREADLSDINRAFSPRKLLFAEYFLSSRPFSVNCRDGIKYSY